MSVVVFVSSSANVSSSSNVSGSAFVSSSAIVSGLAIAANGQQYLSIYELPLVIVNVHGAVISQSLPAMFDQWSIV